jgi:glutamyl-tRNA reductase
VDPQVARIANATVIDLDALHPPIIAAEASRRQAAPVAESIVEQELRDFRRWQAEVSARDAMRPLRDALEAVCRKEVAFVAGEEAAERVASRIVAKLLSRPMISLRAALERGEPVREITLAMEQLFERRNPARISELESRADIVSAEPTS